MNEEDQWVRVRESGLKKPHVIEEEDQETTGLIRLDAWGGQAFSNGSRTLVTMDVELNKYES